MRKTFHLSSFEFATLAFGSILFAAILASSWAYPLQGIHSHRQADTLFAGYSYCFEKTEFLKPRIAHRNDTSGIVIGEFPLFSYLISIPCQLTGQWSESWPKAFSILLFVLATAVWTRLLTKKFRLETPAHRWALAILFFFSTGHLLHFSIPIPDALSVLLIGVAGLTAEPGDRWKSAFSLALFSLGFAIRPYFFPLAFLIYPGWRMPLAALGLCAVVYEAWYKLWIAQSVIPYYATDTKSLSQVISELPRAMTSLPLIFLRNHLNYVLIFPFLAGARRWPKLALLTVFTWVVVVAMKGDHSVNHSYYLGAASLLAVVISWLGLSAFKPWQQKSILAVMVLIGIANVQHLWTDTKSNPYFEIQKVMKEEHIPDKARVAGYFELSPQFLYWSKEIGWLLPATEAQKPCPPQTEFKFYRNDQGQYHFERCP